MRGARRAAGVISRGTSASATRFRFGRRGSRVVESFESLAFELAPHNTFESPDHIIILWCDQGKCVTCSLCSSVTPDAMDIGIGGIRPILVYYMLNTFHIQPARRHVSSHHHLVCANL